MISGLQVPVLDEIIVGSLYDSKDINSTNWAFKMLSLVKDKKLMC
jgi:hypothetical protein